jgi:tRNA (adenine57-N1/adenine58-N1)-methyltransferase
VDALFLDVRDPWRHLEAVRQALKPGGFFAGLLPTTNQVSELLAGLDTHGFTDVAVEELLLRAYKPVPERLRPDDTMIGHTGFLVSARCLPPGVDVTRWHAKERQRFRARQKMQEEIAQAAAAREVDQAADTGDQRKYPRLPLPG